MIRTVFTALLSHWWRNPLQLFTLLAGLALATALWSGVQAINAEARASYGAAAATLGEGQFDQLISKTGEPIAQSTYIALRRAGWQVSPVIEGRLNGQRIVGLDPLTAPGGLGPVTLDAGAELGTFLNGRGQIFAAQATLDALAGVEADLVLSPDVAPATALTDIGIAQRLLGRAEQMDRLIVAPLQPIGRPALTDIAPNLTRQAAQGGSDIARLTDSFHLNLTAFGLLSFAVGIFIVNGAIGLAFEQRRPVIRTLRALGVPLRRLMVLIGAELLVLSLIAGTIGVALGYLIAALLLPDVAATLRGLYGADVAGTLQLRASWWVTGLCVAVGGTLLAASGAFIALARMPLLAAGQARAMAVAAGRKARVQAVLAAALLILTIILGFTADGLIGGFIFLGAMLIGASLALPLILDLALRFGQSLSRAAAAQWFWADTRQQLPGLSLALMALLLAMAANIGVSTMVSSFRLTFVGFLEQRLSSELYVSTEDAAQSATFIAYADPKVDAILPIQSVQVTIRDLPTELFAGRDHSTYRDNWVMLQGSETPWDDVHSGGGIMINEQLSRRGGINIGDTVIVQSTPFKVAGIYGDYGNPIGQALIAEGRFDALFPNVTTNRFGLRLPQDEVADFVTAMERDINLPASATINQANIKAFSLGIFDRTFTVTGALNVLTLAVAGFAILMSLLTLATMRVPQLAPVWAVGMTRKRIGRLELARAVLLAALTSLLALPLGLALAWALLAIVNVAAFGWKLPMYVFPVDYVKLFGFGMLAALLAALWPSYRLSRTPPADLLKVFANER